MAYYFETGLMSGKHALQTRKLNKDSDNAHQPAHCQLQNDILYRMTRQIAF